MILAATGHRPEKLGGYDERAEAALSAFAFFCLSKKMPSVVISGMALGWDTAIATAAVQLGIPLKAAIPFEGQESRWTPPARARYRRLLSHARTVKVVCPGEYSPGKMQKRNEWMVDNADRVIALWNGSGGGTKNCVDYAKRAGVPVDNVWQSWILQPDVRELIG